MELIEDLAAAIDLEMDRQADDISAEFDGIDEPTRSTLAFTELANKERTLQLMHRYETTFVRQYNRTLKLLESKLEKILRNDQNLSPKAPATPTPPAQFPQPATPEPPPTHSTEPNEPASPSNRGLDNKESKSESVYASPDGVDAPRSIAPFRAVRLRRSGEN